MPFKTRKHKTAAADRRITFSENAISYQTVRANMASDDKPKSVKIKAEGVHEDYFYVKSDLVKIIVISFIIISIQITLAVLKFPHA